MTSCGIMVFLGSEEFFFFWWGRGLSYDGKVRNISFSGGLPYERERGGNFLEGDLCPLYILWLRTIPGLLLNFLHSFGQRPMSKGCWLIKNNFCKSRRVFRSFFKHLWYILLKTLKTAFISYFYNWSKGIWDACLMQCKNKQ